jgi:hypothetical protein
MHHSSGSGGSQGVASLTGSGGHGATQNQLWAECPGWQECVSGEVAGESSNGSEDWPRSYCGGSPLAPHHCCRQSEGHLPAVRRGRKEVCWPAGGKAQGIVSSCLPSHQEQKTWKDTIMADWTVKMSNVAKEAAEAAIGA